MGTKFLALLSLIASPSFAQSNLGSLQWGIHNTGTGQQLGIDHYTSGVIQGVVGEDIRLPAPASQARKVIVAVLDTGVDYTHPQLKDALVGPGFNAISNNTNAADTHGHGTHVSGIIAGRIASSGFQGVSQNAVIMPVKVVQTGPNAPIRPQDVQPGAGSALTETVAKGLVYAINNGAEVINLSLAWPSSIRSTKVDAAMALAKQKNVIIVSSAGNDGTTADVYPCIYDNVICVGAHGPDGAFSHFSNYGSMVDISAPGISILSSWPLNKTPVTFAGQVGYEFRDGTSMASPFVAGAFAELLSRGYSPTEAKARILLGSRTSTTKSLFNSPVVDTYSLDSAAESKQIRFGKLDLNGALNVTPSPLILPVKKGIIEIDWDGITTETTLPIQFINQWIATTGSTTITINNQTYTFDSIDANATVDTPFTFQISPDENDMVHLTASVQTEGYSKQNIDIEVRIVRILRSNQIPAEASVQTLVGIDPTAYSGIRTVVTSDQNVRNDLAFTQMGPQGLQIALVQANQLIGSWTSNKLNDTQLLNLYRLPDGSYSAIFTYQDRSSTRPSFYFERFNQQFKFVSEAILGTDTTQLAESFIWGRFKGTYAPLWISIGYTPIQEQPKYDPWNPTWKDTKMPRIYYLDGQTLRSIALGINQLPLQIIEDGRVLISEGSTYAQIYSLLTVQDGKITKKETLNLTNYRMLIGLDVGAPVTNLDGSTSNSLLLEGSSTPGNLHVTGIVGTNSNFDQILERATQLDALVGIIGGYKDQTSQYYFVQTQYNLQLFTSGTNQTYSTTLNRYSYIPSMIFAHTQFPALVRDQDNVGLPAVYTPASIANANVSEIVYADPVQQRLVRPARLHIQVSDPTCRSMGNLAPASKTLPMSEVFICGNNLIQVPLTIRR